MPYSVVDEDALVLPVDESNQEVAKDNDDDAERS